MNNKSERITMTQSETSVPLNKRTTSSRSDWRIPAGLIALTAIPVLAGVVRLVGLAGEAAVTPENARFFAAPVPVIIHIISATLFCILGAFQFAPRFRRRRLGWHRVAGRFLVIAGLASGLSGLWMTQFYPLRVEQLQGTLLYGFRMLIGSVMVVAIVLSWTAIMGRNIARHRAWMIRAYAIGQGAGTQALVFLPWLLIVGIPNELNRDILMITGWLINLAVAEWLIRRNSSRGRQAQGAGTQQQGSALYERVA
ncbi:MAG: DUF2306 domain-containing protein [Roseiflexaceae bacterium]